MVRMAVIAAVVLLLACSAHAQPPQRPGPPGRRHGPRASVDITNAQAFASAPDAAPDDLGVTTRVVLACLHGAALPHAR